MIDVIAISYYGIKSNLPDNIQKTCATKLMKDMQSLRKYQLKINIANQFQQTFNKQIPSQMIIEEIRPNLFDFIVSFDGDLSAAEWLGHKQNLTQFGQVLRNIFVNDEFRSYVNVADIKLDLLVDAGDLAALASEYANAKGLPDHPSEEDLLLWSEIELYHSETIRDFLTWSRDTEAWLESSLGSFLMTCKQLMSPDVPVTDVSDLERKAAASTKPSVDKTGLARFKNAFQKMSRIAEQLPSEIRPRLENTHRFETKFPTLFEARMKTLDLVDQIGQKFSNLCEAQIAPPTFPIYEGWRSKVLAKEADIYLPMLSVIPHFRELVLDIDVQLDEFKAILTSCFPQCRGPEAKKRRESIKFKNSAPSLLANDSNDQNCKLAAKPSKEKKKK